MNLSKPLRLLVFVCLFSAAAAISALAQTDDRTRGEASYEVTLQVLLGSNDAGARSELPGKLENVTRQLRSTFGFTNYRVASTFFARVGNNGNFEYKSTADLQGRESTDEALTFLNWSLISFRKVDNGFRAQSFKFGSQVPVRTATAKDESGKQSFVVNYESIGLSLSNIGVPVNVPTLLGTLTMPRTSGMLFLVMTANPADK
jgi:hypothetical protein